MLFISKLALGGRQYAIHARIRFNCHAQGAAKCLEDGFSNVMGITAPDVINMHGDHAVIYKTLEEFKDEVHIKFTDPRTRIFGVIFKPWTA